MAIEHAPEALSFLKSINTSSRYKLTTGGDIMFRVLDAQDHGWMALPLAEELDVGRSTVVVALQMLTAHNCLERRRAKPEELVPNFRGCPPFIYTAQPQLARMAESYNDVSAEVIAEHMTAEELSTPKRVRHAAVARLALGYRLGSSFRNATDVLDKASERDMGHPQSVLQRSLVSLALMHAVTYEQLARGMQEKVASYT